MSKSPEGKKRFIPETPAGSILMHLAANTEEKAWGNLVRDTNPLYGTKEKLQKRGYKVNKWEPA